MPARTTTKDGSISDATMLNGSTPWVTGDTLTYSHNITIDIDIDAGVGGATGTTAIAASTSVTGKTLTVNSGVRVICRGDLVMTSSYNGTNTLTNNGRISMIPPSGATYKLNMTNNCPITGSGTFDADLSGGGGAPYMVSNNDRCQGLSGASGMTITDWGSTANNGVISKGRNFNPINLSVTDCTFTRSNYGFVDFGDFDNNYTFTGNKFSASPLKNIGAGIDVCASFPFASAGSSGVWNVADNAFDGDVYYGTLRPRMTVTNNVFPRLTSTGGSWTTWTDNIFYAGAVQTFRGPISDSAIFQTGASSTHGFSGSGTVSGCICEQGSSAGNSGDFIFPPTTGSSSFTNIVLLPDSIGNSSGDLLSCLSPVSSSITANHNTVCAKNMENGSVGMDETGGSIAGQIAACRSNLLWSDTAAAGAGAKAINSLAPTTNAVDSVTLATHNAFLNPFIGTCRYDSSATESTQADVVGYQGLRISRDEAYPNAQVGANDSTLSGTPAALFVDVDYDWIAWGVEKGLSAPTAADVFAYMVANPAIATATTTGFVDKVKAAFNITGSQGLTLKDAGHDSVTIGAMGYVAAGGGSTGMNHRTLRPY